MNMHSGNAGKVGVFNTHEWINVGFGMSISCSHQRNLTSGIPLDGSLGIEHFHHVAEHGHVAKYVSGHISEHVAKHIFRVVVVVRIKWVGGISRHIASIELIGEVYTAPHIAVMSRV